MASSSSSSTGPNKRRVKLIKPTRENHYEGEPILCNHMVVAPRWTSWSDDNPGRRFYGCRYYNDQRRRCSFFKWHDSALDDRANIVIKELLDVIDELYDENEMLRQGSAPPIDTPSRFSEANTENLLDVTEEINGIERELKVMKRRQQLNDDEAMRWKMKYHRLKLVVLFALGLMFAYKVYMV